MHVASLHIYPVKSTAPTDLEQAEVEPWGLAGDRRWLVVDADGNQLTAREHRPLLQVHADSGLPSDRPGDRLSLAGPHRPPLEIGPDDFRSRTTAAVWNTAFTATDAGPAAADWFTALLQTPARLVYLHDPTARPNTDARAHPGDSVSAADSYPLLLTTTASLNQLNDWIGPDGVPMTRFRPNVVVESDEPWVEDAWDEIRIGDVTFRSGGPCQRCVMTTIDPATLVSAKEPIRTMAGHRRWDGKTWFGLNLAPIGTGTIAVGDRVSVLG